MNKHIKIIIADDHPFFTEGVINALKPFNHYQVVATPTRGDEVLSQLETHQPDLALLDVNLPGIDGIAISREARKRWPGLKILLLTMYMPSDIQLRGDESFIDGFVLKNSGSDTLLSAIEVLVAGNRFLDPNIKSTSLHSKDNFTVQLKLSTREKEILQLIIEGKSNKDIAAQLFLSELTIKTHRKNIMQKLDAHNLADLIKKSK